MKKQLISLVVVLLLLQCSMVKCETMTFQFQELTLEFGYTPQQFSKPIRMNVTTRPVIKAIVNTSYVLSGHFDTENLLIIKSIACRHFLDPSVQCSSHFHSDYIFLDNDMLSHYHVLKFHHLKLRRLLVDLTSRSGYFYRKNTLTCKILDLSSNHIEKPRDPYKFPLSDTNLFGVIFISVCIALVFLVCIGWAFIAYYRQYKRYRLKKKLREDLEKCTQEVLQKSPILMFDSTDPEYQSIDDEDGPTCAICLETFKNKEEIRKLVCSHYFHVACIDPWVLSRQSCPLCNRNILRHSIPSISSSLMDAINNESASIANQTLPNGS